MAVHAGLKAALDAAIEGFPDDAMSNEDVRDTLSSAADDYPEDVDDGTGELTLGFGSPAVAEG